MNRTLQAALLALSLAAPAHALGPTAPSGGPEARLCAESVPAGMACVPGGWFIRGSDDGPADAGPASWVWLQTFLVDRYEVTVEAYERCVGQGRCPHQKTQYVDFSRPRQPKQGVSWFAAKTYCEVHGQRLPTEAEWEKAARGVDGRTWPWGEEPATCERAVVLGKSGRACGVRKRGRHPKKGRTWEVGQFPPTQFGLYDMAGNSWEWVQDWHSASWADCGDACAGPDPRGPCAGRSPCKGHRRRVVRGGSWYWSAEYARTFHRRAHVPANNPYHHFGFRCAADVDALPTRAATDSPAKAPAPSR